MARIRWRRQSRRSNREREARTAADSEEASLAPALRTVNARVEIPEQLAGSKTALEHDQAWLSALRGLGRFIRRKPLGALGAVIVVVMLVMAAFAERIAPYGYDDTIRGARVMALAILIAAVNSRVIRGATITVAQSTYVEAARAVGCGHARIIARHILPNVTATIIILATIGLGTAILAESALSFLGFGVPPPYPAWGAMLSGSGRTYMFRAPWMAIWPGVAISLAVFGFNMLGDALRDVLDPRLRGLAR